MTYALGIYHLNLFIAFLSPKVDPSLMEDSGIVEIVCLVLSVREVCDFVHFTDASFSLETFEIRTFETVFLVFKMYLELR